MHNLVFVLFQLRFCLNKCRFSKYSSEFYICVTHPVYFTLHLCLLTYLDSYVAVLQIHSKCIFSLAFPHPKAFNYSSRSCKVWPIVNLIVIVDRNKVVGLISINFLHWQIMKKRWGKCWGKFDLSNIIVTYPLKKQHNQSQ